MAIDIQSILDNVASHALATGHFEAVLGYSSKQSSTNGITAAIYVEDIRAIRTSGLSTTTVRLELEMQIYSSTYQEPYNDIDANLVKATDALFTALIGDFDLGGEARNIDVFGAHGQPLRVRSGLMNLSGKEFRVFQIIIPIIVDDCFDQAA
jgi:hypothetical protein